MRFIVFFLAVSACAQTEIVLRTAPCITWTATNGQTYTVQASTSPSGPWTNKATLYAHADGPAAWADPADSASGYYRLSIYSNATGHIQETFEDAGGWSDHAEGYWTNDSTTGRWIGQGCFATSSPPLAMSGSRIIGFRGDWDRLQFPEIGTVTQIIVNYRGSQEMDQQAVIRLLGFDGGKWVQIDNPSQVDHVTYTNRKWNIASPSTWQKYSIESFWNYSPVYIDDITIRY